MYRINEQRSKILNHDQNCARKNLSRKTDIENEFEAALKDEIRKLESKMKIGFSTLKKLAEKLRARKFPDDEKLRKFKFSKPYLKRFASDQKVMFTKRKSNQIKFSEQELKELRKPIDQLLLDQGFTKNRVINLGRGC